MYCTKCGAFIPDDADKCPSCNAIPKKNAQIPNTESTQSGTNEEKAPTVDQSKKESSNYAVTIIIIVAFVAVMLVAIFGVITISRNKNTQTDTPTETSVEEQQEDDNTEVRPEEGDDGISVIMPTEQKNNYAEETKVETDNNGWLNPLPETVSPTQWNAQARFTYANASSVLESSQYGDYAASNVLDNDDSTAWVEGVDGDGIGEYITLFADESAPVNGIKILNGYNKNADIYAKNNRVARVRITLSNGEIYELQLEDSYSTYTSLDFGGPKAIEGMRIEILSVYPGSKYQDTCISEIVAY